MKNLNIFLDTCIINYILDLDDEPRSGSTHDKEDKRYLGKILNSYQKEGKINFFVNPSIKTEINKTKGSSRRDKLLQVFNQYDFMPFNVSVFPWTFPVKLLSKEESAFFKKICDDYPSLKKDAKIIADAKFCKKIDILLTTDRNHLANKDFSLRASKILGLKIFTPRELFEDISKNLNI